MTNIKEVIHLYLGCEVEGWGNLDHYMFLYGNLDKLANGTHKLRLRRLDSISLKDSIEMGIPFEILKEVIAGGMFYPQMFLKLIQRDFWLFGDEAFERGLIIDKNLKP